jgi:hypothetical protein
VCYYKHTTTVGPTAIEARQVALVFLRRGGGWAERYGQNGGCLEPAFMVVVVLTEATMLVGVDLVRVPVEVELLVVETVMGAGL